MCPRTDPIFHSREECMFDIHQSVCDDDSGEIDDCRVEDYVDGLMQVFEESPEAKGIIEEHGLGWAARLMEYGFGHLGLSVPEMSVADFKEVVLRIFPRKISTEPESAADIVAELRAFWSFLQREYALSNAPQMLEALSGDAERELYDALSDPANFGMGKSFFMMGQRAGFDMTTQEGLDQFMLVYNANLLARRMDPMVQEPSRPSQQRTSVHSPRPRLSPKEREKIRKAKLAEIKARKRK
jgi:hypothetical protein